ncbi:MAG: hypothetical protein JW854_15570, partial [Actinobacteria bacterium]|nr:hypothetical protein [Actinomycetota bacterium]
MSQLQAPSALCGILYYNGEDTHTGANPLHSREHDKLGVVKIVTYSLMGLEGRKHMSYMDCCDWSKCTVCGECLMKCPVLEMG